MTTDTGDEADTAPAEWIWTEDLQPKKVPNGIPWSDMTVTIYPGTESQPVALEKEENERLWELIVQSAKN